MDRTTWLDAVRREAKRPPDKMKAATAVAVAAAFYGHGNDDGAQIQVGRQALARETVVSPATVSRVRLWLFERGLGHMESSAVPRRKAVWWHAAVPGVDCAQCSASCVPASVPESRAAYVPASVPGCVPSGGTQPLTTKNVSTEEEVSLACEREAERPRQTCLICRKHPPEPDSSICAGCRPAPVSYLGRDHEQASR